MEKRDLKRRETVPTEFQKIQKKDGLSSNNRGGREKETGEVGGERVGRGETKIGGVRCLGCSLGVGDARVK